MLNIFKKNLPLILLLVIVGSLIYSFNVNNELFWDDNDWIVNNQYVHGFSWENTKAWFTKNTLAGIGLKSNYYRPVLFSTFSANYAISGINPIGFHLINNGLHVANGILIFFLIAWLLKNRLAAFVASLIFLIHPLQTEAVTYVAGRGDPLNVFFMLLALVFFWFAEKNGIGWRSWKRWITLPLVAAALLSRETAVIFPFLALLVYVSFISDLRFVASLKKGMKKTLPYFTVVFLYGVLRLTVLNFENTLNFYSQANPYTEHLSFRLYTFFAVLGQYVKLMLVPLGLHMERAATIFTSLFFWPVILPFLAIIGLVVLLVWFYRRSQKRPSAFHTQDFRVWLFSVGWFFIGLAPTSGITPINAQIYEHWLYLPLIGPAVLLSYYLSKFLNKLAEQRKNMARGAIVLGLAAYLSFFGVLAVKRNIIWGDPIRFFQDILKYEPDSARINNNLGNLYFDLGEEAKAEEHYWKAVAIKDNFPQPHFNLGSILQARGDYYGAIVEYEKALEIDPYFPYAYQNIAVIYAQQGKLEEARDALLWVIKLRPDQARGYLNLAKVELVLKNPQDALAYLTKGLEFADDDPEAKEEIESLLGRLIRN